MRDASRHAWTVVCSPVEHEEEDGTLRRGLAVLLTDGDDRHEVSRVAFSRAASADPDVSFEDKIDGEIEKAWAAADRMNELEREMDRLVEIACEEAQERIREIMQQPSTDAKMS